MVSEYIYSICLSVNSWVIAATFWLRSRDVVALINQFRHPDLDVTFFGLWIAKAFASMLPFVLDAILFSYWNINNTSSNSFDFRTFMYEASFLWLIFVSAVPIISYVILAQMVHDALCTNNIKLAQAAEVVGGGKSEMLMRIHMKNLTLRRLYEEIEQVLSIPLLCSSLIITFTIINNAFYNLVHNSTDFVYATTVPLLLKVVTIMILGRIADKVTAAVSNRKLPPNNTKHEEMVHSASTHARMYVHTHTHTHTQRPPTHTHQSKQK